MRLKNPNKKIHRSVLLPEKLDKELQKYLQENYLCFTNFLTQLILNFLETKKKAG